ncbi:hypothetical protein J5N97_007232 [Dioscorea zingiberensis]|uniref:DYW domain-containing protein n=1 Tax=Dioscorea zingiberensis TaxID=325984 RepID=A0A9D5HUC0_9LILI|nr:hypothetical protein J5N97_007232 [Dioscorea zingiberensis]
MASLPSIAINGTLHRLEPDLRKLSPSSLPAEKSFSYQRSTTAPDSVYEASHPLTIQEALSFLREGPRVEPGFYVPILQQCIENGSVTETECIHGHIIKTGVHEEVFISTSLVNVYMKCGAVDHALKLFGKIPQRNVVTWTALITGYVHNRQPEDAMMVFVQLLESGFHPTNYTLGAVLSACSASYRVEFGEQVHGYIIKSGFESDTSIGNSLCSLYAKCASLESSVKAFGRIPDKNVISWTTVISACGDNGDADLGLRLFVDMISEHMLPNEFTLTSAMSLCCSAHAFDLGKQVHSLCVKFGCDSSLPVKNSIMYLYLKRGEIDEARRLFDSMENVRLITWNAMIAGHAQMMDMAIDDVTAHKSGTEALKMFHRLHQSGMKPDLFSFSSILTVCSALVSSEQGEQVHAQVIKSGFLADVVVSSALVNMYNKCGSIDKASKAFVEMNTRTLISWTSMITAYSQHGRAKEAIQLFEQMRLAGVRPNHVTFVGVLSACAHAGMVNEAQHYFSMMKNEYGIKPVMDHYACMVDMFVRLGCLEGAFDFIKSMAFEPNEIIWSILIAGCRSHGNMEMAFYAAERLLELKPKATETYVLLLNMYVAAERWQDVSRVRKLMKDEKIGVVRDRSWVNIKERVYFFRANDRSHFQSDQMHELLEDLLERAKSLGYVPYKNAEDSDDEKEEKAASGSTLHHSERLAIAFGLLNMPEGAPVRVVKNITMCRDCHSSAKFFSILTGREIIVRDSKRLHKFKDGRCSCGDFELTSKPPPLHVFTFKATLLPTRCIGLIHRSQLSAMRFHPGLGSKARRLFISSSAKKKPLNEEIQVGKSESGFHFRSEDYGSKEETFFDSQAFLDSDCEDDFCSVNGDFTPSCGSPSNNQIGNAVTLNKAFIRDSIPDSKSEISPTNKKKKLADLLQDTFYHDQIVDEKPDSNKKQVDTLKSVNGTAFLSATNPGRAIDLKPLNAYPEDRKERKNTCFCLPSLVPMKGRGIR